MKTGMPIVLCVGSDKISGDSIGPMVGDYLKNSFGTRCFVYGTLGNSVNGTNLNKYLEIIKSAHSNNPVIAVDACLSAGIKNGDVLVREGGINPKKALTDAENRTGDVGILGVLDSGGKNPLSTLMTISVDKVEKIAYKIALLIHLALSDNTSHQRFTDNIFS